MAEIAFEQALGALESTRFTAITTPTRVLNTALTLTPKIEYAAPDETRGTLEGVYQDAKIAQWADWSIDGGLDFNQLPFWLSMAVKGGVSPTQPSAGPDPTVYLWTFTPSISADDIKTATLWGFDPNITRLRAAGAVMQTLEIVGNNRGLVTMTGGGFARFPSKVSVAAPSQTVGELVSATNTLFYMGSTSTAFASLTQVTGRVVDWTFSLPEQASQKWLMDGTYDWSGIGRSKRRPMLTVQMEIPDMTQYDLFAAGTEQRFRLRCEGSVISNAYKYYVEIDFRGRLNMTDWGTYVDTNRTATFEVAGIYDATLGASYQIKNENTTSAIT